MYCDYFSLAKNFSGPKKSRSLSLLQFQNILHKMKNESLLTSQVQNYKFDCTGN